MKRSFMIYERNLESILNLCMAATLGALIVFVGGALVHDYLLYSNVFVSELQKLVGIETQSHLLTIIGAIVGASIYSIFHQNAVKKGLKENAERQFDEVIRKGVIFAVKEAYKDLGNSNGKLHNNKLSLLYTQARSAVTIATLGDINIEYVSKALENAVEVGRTLSKVATADTTPNIAIKLDPCGFNVSIRLNGEYLKDPRDPNP